MAIAITSHSLLPLISFLFSLSLFILFLLSLFLKTHKTRKAPPHLEKPPSCQTEPLLTFSTEEEEPPKEEDRKKKRRAKKKRQEPTLSESGIGDGEVGRVVGTGSRKGSAGTGYPLFPFTSLTSSLQRRIKLKYDEIVRSANQSSSLTVFQVLPPSLSLSLPENFISAKSLSLAISRLHFLLSC